MGVCGQAAFATPPRFSMFTPFSQVRLAFFGAALLSVLPAVAQDKAPAGKSYGFDEAIDTSYDLPWSTRIIYGFETGSSDREARFDIFFPFAEDGNTVYFLYPRVSWPNHTDGGASLGLGARHYIEGMDALVGANIFYDNYESLFGNRFSQLGLGAEFLTETFDFRFNYYIPEDNEEIARSANVATPFTQNRTSFGTPFAQRHSIFQPRTTRTRGGTINQVFESREQPMDGFDSEAGIKVPYFDALDVGDLRLYGGYLWFDNPYGSDLEGAKARAEWNLSSKLALETTWFEEEAFVGDNWTFGFRVNLPIEDGPNSLRDTFAGLFRDKKEKKHRPSYSGIGSHVYAASGSGVLGRAGMEINRINTVQTSESGFSENRSKRTVVLGESSVERTIDEVHDDIVFVNRDPGTPTTEQGTFENPALVIQDGVDIAGTRFGNSGQVIVNGDFGDYAENVADAGRSVQLWGGKRGIPVNGGKRFRYGGTTPRVDGGFEFADIGMARVTGFEIFGGSSGIEMDDVTKFYVTHNEISDTDVAIDIIYDGGIMAEFTIGNNFIHDNGDGIEMDPSGSDIDDLPTIVGRIEDNVIMENDNSGFSAEDLEDEYFDITLDFVGNRFVENGEDAIYLDGIDMDESNQFLEITARKNDFIGNERGIVYEWTDHDGDDDYRVDLRLNVIGNYFMDQDGEDVLFLVGSDSDNDGAMWNYRLHVRDNTFKNSGGDSVAIMVDDNYDGGDTIETWDVDIVGNTFMDVGGSAVNIDLPMDSDSTFDSLDMDFNIRNNRIDTTGGDGINLEVTGPDFDNVNVTATIAGNTILNVSDTGIDVLFGDMETSSLVIGGNMIMGADTGIEIDGADGTTLDDGVFGNNLVSDADDTFSISDVDGTILINGVEEP